MATWSEIIQEELQKPYMLKLNQILDEERKTGQIIYPPTSEIFNAFKYAPFEKVKVIIVGQDPYHGHGQAHGLSFSVAKGVRPPPSLKNIFKEIGHDLGIQSFDSGCLTSWAQQGVLLLNATLSVRAKTPRSHGNIGWEQFTDYIIEKLANEDRPLVFLLWGKFAQEKCQRVMSKGNPKHLILQAAHPSPYSAYNGFFGCRHFSKANEFLKKQGLEPIDWQIKD